MTARRELQEAERLIDASYRELGDRPRCRGCGTTFTQTSLTQNYCSGVCALKALYERERVKSLAPEVA